MIYFQITLLSGLVMVTTPELSKEAHCASFEIADSRVDQSDRDTIERLINSYHVGFIEGNFEMIRNSIGEHLIMMNGNFSDDPVDWQAHQFLNSTEIDDWTHMMLNNAGPFENKIEILNIHINASAAIVTTREEGNNKFRSWKNEQVVYMLGKIDTNWKIVGFYIKNLKNPE